MLYRFACQVLWTGILVLLCAGSLAADDGRDAAVQAALERAGANRPQLEAALAAVDGEERAGMRFLVANMPDRDLQALTSEFLLDNVRATYTVWRETPWKDQVPQDVFLNNVLPYASINERRDNWRKDFHQRFAPLVRDATSPGQAATILNRQIFGLVNVKYSTKRAKADQSPLESIESGLASCTGLSILLIDACRAVGVPARFVGTPLWSDKSGNHSWVEVWDDGWHFTGAAEPAGEALDQAWFIARASQAQRDHPLHAIYATSFQRTPQHFPLVWDRSVDDVWAVNVTDRYTSRQQPLPDGSMRVAFVVHSQASGDRVTAQIAVQDDTGETVFKDQSKDERFDANDHLTAVLRSGCEYQLQVTFQDQTKQLTFRADKPDTVVRVELP